MLTICNKKCRFQQNLPNAESVLNAQSHGHVLHAYVNGVHAGKLLDLLILFRMVKKATNTIQWFLFSLN